MLFPFEHVAATDKLIEEQTEGLLLIFVDNQKEQ